MLKRNDMYIDYKRSFKKRGRKNNNKLGIIIVVILALAIGMAVYFGVRGQMTSGARKDGTGPGNINNTASENPPTNQPAISQPPITQPPVTGPAVTQPAVTQSAAEPTAVPVKPTPTSATFNPTDWDETDTRIPVKVRGVYVTAPAAGSDRMEELLALADNTEINTMVIDIKDDHGKISYAMDNTLAAEIGATTNLIPDLPDLISRLKAKDIYLIARIVAFKDPYLAEQRQDLAVHNQDGTIYRDSNGEGWVNPYNRKVWDYLVEIASQAAAVGFNEVQFDYIRFSTGQGISEADFGEDAKTASKEEIITEFTKYAYEKIRPLGVYVSADVYGTIISSSIDAGLVGQNYVEMSEYLDYICPMIYPSHFGEGNYGIKYPDQEPYNIIHKVLAASEEDLSAIPESRHKAVVRPWLQAFTASWIEHYMEYGGDEIRAQIDGVYSVGYDEWILWNAACNYTEDGLLKE